MVAAANAGAPLPRLDVPAGFTASLYVRGIGGARDLDVAPDGTLTLRGRAPDERFEIAPATDDRPLTVMRVAAGLGIPPATDAATVAVRAPHCVRLRWNAASGELGYALASDVGRRVVVAPRTLALARALARHREAAVALAPDGTMFVADSRAGAVWRIRPTAL